MKKSGRGGESVTPSGARGGGPSAAANCLVDAHAHFLHAECGRSDWRAVNEARFRAGVRIGITYHVASILGSYGFTSPTYFPSPTDVVLGNDAMLALLKAES